MSNVDDITTIIKSLNINKPTTFNNIPAKAIVLTNDISAPIISKIYNDSILSHDFPQLFKKADINPHT